MSINHDSLQNFFTKAREHHLTEESPQAEQPSWIRTPLRPHQRTLLAAARVVESYASLKCLDLSTPTLLSAHGILADRVGAGKSLVALSLVRDPPVNPTNLTILRGGSASIIGGIKPLAPVTPWHDEWNDISGSRDLLSVMMRPDETILTSTSLMIVPHNVIQQWETYIREQTDLRAVIIRKKKDCAFESVDFYRSVFRADVVVVSCTMLNVFIGAMSYYLRGNFNQIVWSRLFIDEADTLAIIVRANQISARFIWFITGSWLNMLFPCGFEMYRVNALPVHLRLMMGNGEIRGLLKRNNLVAAHVSHSSDPRFASLILRNTDAWIDASIRRPTIHYATILCLMPPNMGVLRGFISPAAMEALHAGDTASALTVLGLKPLSQTTLAAQVTAKLRVEAAEAQQLLEFKRGMTYSSPSAKVHALEKAEAKVARLQTQLASLEERLASLDDAVCPICFEPPTCVTLTPCCRQSFCLACVCECIQKTPACPLCRERILSPQELIVVGKAEADEKADEKENEKKTEKRLKKTAALLKLLTESSSDRRFLVFSTHEASFHGLRESLETHGIRCELLQGTASRVENLRKLFRNGTVRVLCMNARHVGAGINLEAATDVVLYHRMNVELERQVIGRAVRFERAADLTVTYLVHDDETATVGVGGGSGVGGSGVGGSGGSGVGGSVEG